MSDLPKHPDQGQTLQTVIESNSNKIVFGSFFNWFDSRFHKNALYIWTTTWVLFVVFFGLVVTYNYTNKIDTNFSTVVIWAIAYFFLGGLFGCIFGVPKAVSKPQLETPIAKDKKSNTVEMASIETTKEEKKTSAKITYNSGNTNLTDISDWLTKIVIGAGLVQLIFSCSFVSIYDFCF